MLPNGEKIIHLTVGGRTSCVVPSVQKKTGAVAGDIKKEQLNGDEDFDDKKASKPMANASKKRKAVVEEEGDVVEPNEEEPEENGAKGKAKKAKPTPKGGKVKVEEAPSDDRRRSGRASKTK
jgi:formamidopyrimidine-DNA glycosylase